ncbi:MAG: hypothetical protein DME24_12550 [Verrucomicrobia bacterium]|nr:MAG: hypothetical protein DME24_12550 [Verrucomicrobiota bacterium]
MKKLTLLFSTATLALFCSAAEAAIITVNTTNNINPVPLIETSLQQALTNLHDGDMIRFNIPGNGPFHLQTPTNGYPVITNNSITIDGYSQPGSSPNTNEILAPNNAKIQIVLDSRDGPEQRTRLESLNNSGFFGWESAILAVQGGGNFKIDGIGFLSRHTAGTGPDPSNQDPGDPEIYCIALINAATNARISGCWFGLDPDGVTVAGGRSSVAAFKDGSGASASGLIFGTDGDGQNDAAEFNLSLGMGLAVNLAAPNVKVAGNFFNVFPNGTTFLDLSTINLLDGGGIESIENRSADNMFIGTDGDGVSDANERNIFGPVFSDTFARFSGAATNITFAGNHVGVGIDGQSTVPRSQLENDITLFSIQKQSSIRVGSNFDGVSDALEGNLIENLGCQMESCDTPARAFVGLDDSNNDDGGADAARIVLRGNTLVNNASAILMQDQNVAIATYYSTVLADSTNDFATVLSTNAAGTQLLVTIPPPNTNKYSTAIVDFYAVDPVGLTNAIGQTNVAVHATPLASVVDGSADDLDSATNNSVTFDISNLNLIGVTTVAALVTYSADANLVTQAGRAVTAIFSNPVTVNPVASPLRIRSFSYAGGYVTFALSGGSPPYQLQVRTNLTTDNWTDLGVAFTNTPIRFPAFDGSESFYRVSGQ